MLVAELMEQSGLQSKDKIDIVIVLFCWLLIISYEDVFTIDVHNAVLFIVFAL